MSSNDGIARLRAIEQQFDGERSSVADRKSLEDARTRYLSRKAGLLTLELQSLGKLPRSSHSCIVDVPVVRDSIDEKQGQHLDSTILKSEGSIEMALERAHIEAREVKQLGDTAIGEHACKIGRGNLGASELHGVTGVVSRRELREA